MKPRISGINSSGAPSNRNSGPIVRMPMALMIAVIRKDNNRLSVDSRRARRWSSAPSARATTEEVPAPRPIATLVTIMRMGKPKLNAASCASPTWPMNQVSMRPWAIIVAIPKSTGTVMSTRCLPTGPCVSLGLGEFIGQGYHCDTQLEWAARMKFRHEIVIDADQESVWTAFDDPGT